MHAKATSHVLGVVGSPRRQGNTETVVDMVLRGAQEAGAQVEKIILNELTIGPCQACDHCVSTGECTQQDDMPMILEKMRRSHVWVLGTPVYFWGPTAQFKAFLDRWYSAKHTPFEKQRAIIAVPMGEHATSHADCTIETLKMGLAYLGLEPFATLVIPDIWDPGEIHERTTALEAAYRVGQEAVAGKTPPVQDAAPAAPPVPRPNFSKEDTVWIDDLSKMIGARLVVTGAPIPFPKKNEVLIGRAKPGVVPPPDLDLVPHGGDQMGVSRSHAKITRGPDAWMLDDLNSTNGTFLNGVQVLPGRPVPVHTGDVVRFGSLTLVFYE
jgi:multimeric flavodoxin WrbA